MIGRHFQTLPVHAIDLAYTIIFPRGRELASVDVRPAPRRIQSRGCESLSHAFFSVWVSVREQSKSVESLTIEPLTVNGIKLGVLVRKSQVSAELCRVEFGHGLLSDHGGLKWSRA